MNNIKHWLDKTSERGLAYHFFLFLIVAILLKLVYLFASPIWRVDIFFYIQGAKTMLDGGVLFKNFVEIKPPGIFFIYYWLSLVFGYSNILVSIKLLALLSQSLTALFVSTTASRIYTKKTGFAVGMAFLLSSSICYSFWPPNIMLIALTPLLVSIWLCFLYIQKPMIAYLFFTGLCMGISSVISTNLILFTLIVPILCLMSYKSLKKFLAGCLIAFAGFIVVWLLLAVHFYLNNALTDWLWWNFKWASIYGGTRPIYLRIFNFFWGMIRSWQILPLYVLSFYSLYIITKKRLYQNHQDYLVLGILFVISLLSRLAFGKSEPRYYLYMVPFMVLLLPLAIKGFKKILVKKTTFIFLAYIIIALSYTSFEGISKPYRRIVTRKVLHEAIKEFSEPTDRIFVWSEGYEIYLMSERSMAGSFFSPAQHLANGYIWMRNGFRNIDVPWQKFMIEFATDQPELIIDLTGNFKGEGEEYYDKSLFGYMKSFIKEVNEKYSIVSEFGSAVIWKKK